MALVQRKARGLARGARVVCMQDWFHEEEEQEEEEGEEEGGRGGARAAADAAPPAFRCVPMREEAPRHAVPTLMSFGRTAFYVYERL